MVYPYTAATSATTIKSPNVWDFFNDLVDDSGVLTSGVVTAASGWTISSQSAHRRFGVIVLQVSASYSGSTVTVGSDGNVTDQLVATIDAAWLPSVGPRMSQGGSGPGVFGYMSTGGNVYISAVAPGTSFTSGFATAFSFTYHKAA